jgi:hypothetical protein
MRLKKIWIIIGAILLLISGILYLIREHRSKASANKIFGNMSYLTDSPYFSEQAPLVNGLYEWKYISEDNAFSHYRLEYTGQYVYGDLNHDGLKDAVVIVIENSGGNADWHTLAFLINDGKKLVHRASGLLGDRAIINSLRQKNGRVIVDMFVHQDGDCMAGPTGHVKGIFEYSRGGRWIEGMRISAKSFFDPILYILKDPSSWAYVCERWKI